VSDTRKMTRLPREKNLFWMHERRRRTSSASVIWYIVLSRQNHTDRPDAGLVVSGAKVVATASALTRYNFIAHFGLRLKKKGFAIICAIPMDAPGVKLHLWKHKAPI
jgi:aromatic ring hydroxylase